MPDYEIRIRVTGPDAEHAAAQAAFRLRTDYLPAAGYLVNEPRLINPPGSTIEQLPAEVLADQPAHAYASTACHHGLHDRCRQSCKFCVATCGCTCHQGAGP